MILKMATRDESSVIGNQGWRYIDRIADAQTFGNVLAPDAGLPDGGHHASVTIVELRSWVAACWGTEREFADEIWPEFASLESQMCVSCVRLKLVDGAMVLALLTDQAFLMNDGGGTIDRLR